MVVTKQEMEIRDFIKKQSGLSIEEKRLMDFFLKTVSALLESWRLTVEKSTQNEIVLVRYPDVVFKNNLRISLTGKGIEYCLEDVARKTITADQLSNYGHNHLLFAEEINHSMINQ